MQFVFNNNANQSGIYKITNLTNGRIYIGSTYRFKERSRNHRNDLLANRHLNTYLQNDFNKCGADAFVFEVLEVIQGDKMTRLAREQEYLDQYYDNQKQCYNLAKLAIDNRIGTKNKNAVDPLTDGRCKSPSEEVLEKRSKAIREAKSSPESKQRARDNCVNGLWKDHSANVTLKNTTTGEVVHVTESLRKFALERGLNYKALHMMISGKSKSSGGWVRE